MELKMENLETRVQHLEKRCRILTRSVAALVCFAAYASFSGGLTINRSATAQSPEAEQLNAALQSYSSGKEGEEQKIPTVVEAQVFVLKDSTGQIRGVWNADNQTTSFAMMHKGKFPVAAISVDDKNASLSLTDVYQGKINMSLVNSVRSISVTDDTKNNNIYLGLTGNGAASIDLVSSGDSEFSIDGAKSTIDLTGDKTTLAMTETVGGTVALQAQPAAAVLSYIDHQGKSTMKLSTIDGKTAFQMESPATRERKDITTAPDEPAATAAPVAEEAAPVAVPAEEKADAVKAEEKKNDAEKKEENKEEKKDEAKNVVDMKSYSPFGEK